MHRGCCKKPAVGWFNSARRLKPLSRRIAKYNGIRGLLPKNGVFVLDKDTDREMREGVEAAFPFDYSIALDTQTVIGMAKKLCVSTAVAFDFSLRHNDSRCVFRMPLLRFDAGAFVPKRPVQKGRSVRLKMFQQTSEQASLRNAS
ncbi:hypothetical protein B0G76_4561 [Paraburkholderia sp. BL23I1N1]|nr:hypothetical protein B0G76_4561 [Paraburkholderia sp. BL23I1N1]